MPGSSPIDHGSIRSAGTTGDTSRAALEPLAGYGRGNCLPVDDLAQDYGLAQDNFRLGADPAQDLAASVRVRGNFLPADDLARGSGRRAAGQGQGSYLPAGEAAMRYKT